MWCKNVRNCLILAKESKLYILKVKTFFLDFIYQNGVANNSDKALANYMRNSLTSKIFIILKKWRTPLMHGLRNFLKDSLKLAF